MTLARFHTVAADAPGAYHVVTRCVRRAWLCGFDALSGRDFSHRRRWIETRILQLAEHFSIAVYAYAVMTNHVHLVVQTDPQAAQSWDAENVVRRWSAVSRRTFETAEALEHWVEGRIDNATLVEEYRKRLGSLSWFMRLLNEPIARQANAEDDCTGRFWEGRFHCQALLDEAAVLSAMAYVDLNPVRAGIADTPEAAEHVSIRLRYELAKRNAGTDSHLSALVGIGSVRMASEAEYLELVEATGRMLRDDKRGVIDRAALPILCRLGLSKRAWVEQVRGTRSGYWRAIGSLEALLCKATELGQRWLKGVGFARRLRAAT